VLETEAPEPLLKDIPVVQEFPDVFSEEISGMPPPREVKFCIDLMLGATPISKAPYRMAPVELKELKTQLDELLDKGYNKIEYVPMGTPVLFVNKKDRALRFCIDYRNSIR